MFSVLNVLCNYFVLWAADEKLREWAAGEGETAGVGQIIVRRGQPYMYQSCLHDSNHVLCCIRN